MSEKQKPGTEVPGFPNHMVSPYWQIEPNAPKNRSKSAVVTEPSSLRSAGQGFERSNWQEPSSDEAFALKFNAPSYVQPLQLSNVHAVSSEITSVAT